MAQGNQHSEQARRQKHARAILKKLKDQALRDCEVMSKDQIRCAEIYLRKTVPDLRSTEHKGSVEIKQFMVEHGEVNTPAGTK